MSSYHHCVHVHPVELETLGLGEEGHLGLGRALAAQGAEAVEDVGLHGLGLGGGEAELGEEGRVVEVRVEVAQLGWKRRERKMTRYEEDSTEYLCYCKRSEDDLRWERKKFGSNFGRKCDIRQILTAIGSFDGKETSHRGYENPS